MDRTANISFTTKSGGTVVEPDHVLYNEDLRNARVPFLTQSSIISWCQNVIDAGSPDGYRFVAVRHRRGLRIRAGCRWFTVAEAKKHWRSRRDRAATRAALRYVIDVAKARGWRV